MAGLVYEMLLLVELYFLGVIQSDLEQWCEYGEMVMYVTCFGGFSGARKQGKMLPKFLRKYY